MKPLVMGAVVGLVLTYLIGYNQIYSRQQNQVRLLRSQLAQEQANQSLQKETEGLFKQLDEYRAQLPAEPDPSWLAREAMSASNRAGIEIDSIQQDPPRTDKLATHISVNLVFQATYHQLGTFLDALEKSDHFMRVERLSVASDRSSAGQSRIQLTLGTIALSPQSAAASQGSPMASAPLKQKTAVK